MATAATSPAGTPSPFAATIYGITSSQVEAMCRFTPPSKISQAGFAPAPIFEAAPARTTRAGPKLNVEDIPEARARTRHRAGKKLGARKCGKQPQAKMRLLPEDAEVDDFEANEIRCDSDDNEIVEEADETWCCSKCTFENASILPFCEMCEAPKCESEGRSAASGATSALRLAEFQDLWPGVREDATWAMCDVSSIGSSWADLAADQRCVEEEEAESWTLADSIASPAMFEVRAAGDTIQACVLAGTTASQTQPEEGAVSWATRIARSSATVTPSVPAHARASMPERRRPAERPDKLAPAAYGEYDELDLLEYHRLCPKGTRGATQRLRVSGRRGR